MLKCWFKTTSMSGTKPIGHSAVARLENCGERTVVIMGTYDIRGHDALEERVAASNKRNVIDGGAVNGRS